MRSCREITSRRDSLKFKFKDVLGNEVEVYEKYLIICAADKVSDRDIERLWKPLRR